MPSTNGIAPLAIGFCPITCPACISVVISSKNPSQLMAPPPATKSKLVQKIKPNKAKKAAAKAEAKQTTVQVAATNTVRGCDQEQ